MDYYVFSKVSAFDVLRASTFKVNDSFYADHYNPYYQLIAVTDGPVYLQAENERITLNQGEIYLLSPYESHQGWNRKEPTGAFCYAQFAAHPTARVLDRNFFSSDLKNIECVEPGLDPAGSLLVPRRFIPRRIYKLLGLFESLLEEFAKPHGNYRFRASLLLGGMLELIATDMLEMQEESAPLPGSYLTYRRTVDYLNDFFPSSQVSSAELERRLKRKYEYLSTIFRKYSGMTIVQYMNKLRIERARYLLDHTRKKVNEIAQEVGCADPYYFSKLFKLSCGMTPSEYRNRTE